jgi:hypothetical protein
MFEPEEAGGLLLCHDVSVMVEYPGSATCPRAPGLWGGKTIAFKLPLGIVFKPRGNPS